MISNEDESKTTSTILNYVCFTPKRQKKKERLPSLLTSTIILN